jgi:hypothetical protein
MGTFNPAKKFTALLKLRRALLEENYEECRGIIEAASHYGAQQTEIRSVINHPAKILEGE